MSRHRSPIKITTPALTISITGMQPSFADLGKSAAKQACDLGAINGRVCLIKPPSNATGRGFQVIQSPDFTELLHAEGVWLDIPRSAVMMQTRDCQTLILWNESTKRVVATHAGRPAMTRPADCSACTANVLTTAIRVVVNGGDPRHVHCWIVGSICGYCFTHDHPGADKFVQPFDAFGPEVFTNRTTGALNLPALTRLQLEHAGVPAHQIYYDNAFCTKGNDKFASHRRGITDKYNTVTVVRHT